MEVEEAMEMASSLLVSALPRNSVPAFRPVHVQRGSEGREGVRSQSNRRGGERTIVEESGDDRRYAILMKVKV